MQDIFFLCCEVSLLGLWRTGALYICLKMELPNAEIFVCTGECSHKVRGDGEKHTFVNPSKEFINTIYLPILVLPQQAGRISMLEEYLLNGRTYLGVILNSFMFTDK